MIEVLAVVLLIGLITGVAVPAIYPSDFRVTAGVRDLALELNAVHREAVVRQHDMVVRVDTAAGRMHVHTDTDGNGTVDPGEPTHVVELPEGVAFALGGAAPLAGAASATTFTPRGTLPAVVFRRSGSASEEGLVYLTSEEARRSGASPNHARALSVTRATGRVTCWSHRTGSWEPSC